MVLQTLSIYSICMPILGLQQDNRLAQDKEVITCAELSSIFLSFIVNK